MSDFDVNPLALVAGVLAMQVLGFLWYGPILGKVWMRAMGKSREELANAAGPIIISIVASTVAVIGLAWMIGSHPSPDAATGAIYGLIVSVAFVATAVVTSAAYESKSWTVAAIYIGYNLVGLTLVGAILGAWR
jgi:uncharacterized membrane protein